MFTYGLQPPEDLKDAPFKYGCRAIDYGKTVDVPYDRQTFDFEDSEVVKPYLNYLNDKLGKHVANYALDYFNKGTDLVALADPYPQGSIHTIYADPNMLVQAKRTGGYIYVGAWFRANNTVLAPVSEPV